MPKRKASRKTTPENKYIIRVDCKYEHAWHVRWCKSGVWNEGVQSKAFSDKKYGGKREAFKAAQEYRNSILKKENKLHLLEHHATEFHKICEVKNHVHNSSGIIGVRKETQYKNINDIIYIYTCWAASGSRNGIHWRKQFSINRFGERTAFLKACEARYERHGKLYIHKRLWEFPCKPNVPYVCVKYKL